MTLWFNYAVFVCCVRVKILDFIGILFSYYLQTVATLLLYLDISYISEYNIQ